MNKKLVWFIALIFLAATLSFAYADYFQDLGTETIELYKCPGEGWVSFRNEMINIPEGTINVTAMLLSHIKDPGSAEFRGWINFTLDAENKHCEKSAYSDGGIYFNENCTIEFDSPLTEEKTGEINIFIKRKDNCRTKLTSSLSYNTESFEGECFVDSDCGESSSQLICQDNNVVNEIITPLCVDSACEFDTSFELVEECEFGCEDAECLPEPEIECYEDSDCGDDGCIGMPNYCLEGNVYQDFIFFTCNNPGTPQSFCSNITSPFLLEDCEFGCEDGFCISNEECSINEDCGEESSELICVGSHVVNKTTTPSCVNEGCINNITQEVVEECIYGCENGSCLPPQQECLINSDCGDVTSEIMCAGDNVNNKTITPVCTEGSCSSNTTYSLVEECEDECENSECVEDDEGDGNGGGGGGRKFLSTGFCGNGICEETEGENEFNCEEDCKIEVLSFGTTEAEEEIELKGKISEKTDLKILFYLFLFILLLILIIIVVYFIIR